MPEIDGDRYLVQAGWEDVPHLDEHTKRRLIASTPPYLRDARTKGIPSLGSGAIYPIPESDIAVDPFPVPRYWRKVYGLDVGWNKTACVWGAHDLDTDIVYLYSEHYRGRERPAIHAQAIRARGIWIPGTIDPAARGRSQVDGTQLLTDYTANGLLLTPADNAVETGIYDVWERLETGRLKVFRTLTNWFAEYRLYRRDEHGRIIKAHDHAMDATRYLIRTGLSIAKVQPVSAGNATASEINLIGDHHAGY